MGRIKTKITILLVLLLLLAGGYMYINDVELKDVRQQLDKPCPRKKRNTPSRNIK